MLGVIFDMDGVLVDSTDAHYVAFKTFGEKLGVPFTWEFFRKVYGLHNRTIFPLWLGDRLTPEQIERYAYEKESLYRELAPTHVKPLPGVIALIDALHEEGFKLAVGSSGPRENVEVAMDIIGRRSVFETSVSGDDVPHGKPAPDIFLKAAHDLGLTASECAVIEDARAGIQAALAAKMKVIGICSSLTAPELASASKVIDNFAQLSPAAIRDLILS